MSVSSFGGVTGDSWILQYCCNAYGLLVRGRGMGCTDSYASESLRMQYGRTRTKELRLRGCGGPQRTISGHGERQREEAQGPSTPQVTRNSQCHHIPDRLHRTPFAPSSSPSLLSSPPLRRIAPATDDATSLPFIMLLFSLSGNTFGFIVRLTGVVSLPRHCASVLLPVSCLALAASLSL